MFMLWNDPIFEFWEVNKTFNFTGADSLGLYSGSFYLPALLILLGFVVIGCFGLLFTRKRVHDLRVQIQAIMPDRVKPKRWILVSGIITIFVVVMVPIGVGSYYVPKSNPQILSRMGNEGILWLASGYDHISQKYSLILPIFP